MVSLTSNIISIVLGFHIEQPSREWELEIDSIPINKNFISMNFNSSLLYRIMTHPHYMLLSFFISHVPNALGRGGVGAIGVDLEPYNYAFLAWMDVAYSVRKGGKGEGAPTRCISCLDYTSVLSSRKKRMVKNIVVGQMSQN